GSCSTTTRPCNNATPRSPASGTRSRRRTGTLRPSSRRSEVRSSSGTPRDSDGCTPQCGVSGGADMTVAGLMLVRNEADILAINLRHHLRIVDQLFVIDNGSSDDTPSILRRFARRFPQLRWTTDDGPYLQSKLLTRLAHDARVAGAHWVLPIDADEFW